MGGCGRREREGVFGRLGRSERGCQLAGPSTAHYMLAHPPYATHLRTRAGPSGRGGGRKRRSRSARGTTSMRCWAWRTSGGWRALTRLRARTARRRCCTTPTSRCAGRAAQERVWGPKGRDAERERVERGLQAGRQAGRVRADAAAAASCCGERERQERKRCYHTSYMPRLSSLICWQHISALLNDLHRRRLPAGTRRPRQQPRRNSSGCRRHTRPSATPPSAESEPALLRFIAVVYSQGGWVQGQEGDRSCGVRACDVPPTSCCLPCFPPNQIRLHRRL